MHGTTNTIISGYRKFCQRESNFDKFFLSFLFDEWREGVYTTMRGPSAKRNLNAGLNW